MKRLNKILINSEKLMDKDEMVAIRGGYGGWLTCSGGEYGYSCDFFVPGCDGAPESYCPLCPGGWTSAVCVGW